MEPSLLHLPTVCGEHTARAVKGAGASRSPSSVRNNRRGVIPDDGHERSATHRPGNVSWCDAGFTLSVIQARSMGSSITPVSMPFSQ
jgi:hypothetical protein